ncbi:MAG: biotin transporter BioY [Eubacterium sp.]|nr:biotin transporter BioY [Eubacterium sp.]
MREKTATSGYLAKMVLTALVAAVFCVAGPISIPIGPIPLSLMTLLLFLSVYILGYRYALVACLLYLLLGLAGLPVFTGWQGGFGKLAGPTGGYLVGYIPMVAITGIVVALTEKKKARRVIDALGMIVATAVLYVLGTAWFVVSTGTPVGGALLLCVVPFLPGDLIKIVIAVGIGPEISRMLKRVYH